MNERSLSLPSTILIVKESFSPLISPASSRFLNDAKRRTSFSTSRSVILYLSLSLSGTLVMQLRITSVEIKVLSRDGNRTRCTRKRDTRVITCATAVFEDEAVRNLNY